MSNTKNDPLYIGLMSGTSLDGVDAALCRFSEADVGMEYELISFETHPFDASFSDTLRRLPNVPADELSALNVEVGKKLAKAARSVLDTSGVEPDQVRAIGSHGHTAYHGPEDRPPSTLQIGEEAVIAGLTGIPVIGDVRVADVAAGGEGAPLSPMADWLLWRSPGNVRVIVNLGGIVNPTYLPPDNTPENVIAFDSGPGNMLLNELARRRDVGPYDEDGDVASEGHPISSLVEAGCRDPYFQLSPPKSTGRRDFGSAWVEQWLMDAPSDASTADLLASGTQLIATVLHQSITRFFPGTPDEIVLTGGGRKNRDLVERIREKHDAPVRTAEEAGINGEAREAVSFALFAHLAEREQPATLPGVTGADHSVLAGKRTPPVGRPETGSEER